MKSECQDISNVEKSLSVSVDGEEILKEIDRAYRKLNQRVRIDGFRKGKVPRQVLERQYKQEVENDVLARVISQAYGEALEEHSIRPVSQPEIQNSEFIPGQDLRFTAKVEVRPDIELKQYKGLTATAEAKPVTDDEVAKELEQLRQQNAQVVPVEDREVIEKGDLVVTNFQATIDGEGFKGGQASGYVIDTGDNNFVDEVVEALVGKPLNTKFSVEGTLPEHFHNTDVAGKTAQFVITPVQIKHKKLPELDDEFAKDLGDFENLDAVRQKLREQMEQRAQQDDEDRFDDAVVSALIDVNPFDMPPSLVERQIDLIVYQTFGRTPPEQLKGMGIDFAALREELKPQAEKRVRRGMLLEAIADAEKIEITKADVDARIVEVAAKMGQPVAKLKGLYKGERAEELSFSLRLEHALKIVKDSLDGAAPVEAPEAPTAAAAEAQGEGA